MKKLLCLLPILFGMAAGAATGSAQTASYPEKMPQMTNEPPITASPEEMAAVFADPTAAVRTAVYWYWLSGNISCEGVAEDVRAMKSVGIDRAQIGDIGVDDLERGKVRTFDDNWWKAIHTALKTATETGVEIGIFNSPGWSQSGGPWIDASKTMRYLTGDVLEVTGPRKQTLAPQKREEFQTVKVLAFPKPVNAVLAFPMDAPGLTLAKAAPAQIMVESNAPFTARSLTIETGETAVNGSGVLEAKQGDEWKQIAEFALPRSNPSQNVGFVPFAPIVVSFEAVCADAFRVTLASDRDGVLIKSAVLETMPKIASYAEKTLAKMHPTPQPMWTDYQWPQEVPVDAADTMLDREKMIDLTEKVTNDSLEWDVPEGDWVVFWTGMLPTGAENTPAVPEATGYETDKMSREHIAYHFDAMMGEILRRIPEQDRKSFKYVIQDSYEVGGQNFTDDFIPAFEAKFGYDPTPYLPAYFGYVTNAPEDSDRFLWDMRRFVADRVAYDYVGGLRDASNQYGLSTWLECYGHWGFPGEFLLYGGQSDEIAGEYWSEGTLGDIENRIASSCGHIYGKRKIWSESNTCGGAPFSRSPVDMKIRTDRFFSEGINQTLLHLYVQQPDERVPGINAWFGNEFNRHNTWFSQMNLFTAYLKRANYLLQQGENVADVAYFIGEDAPKMTGAVDPALPAGYQYDFINAEVLESAAYVKDGYLTLPHGTRYEVLVLPPLETMCPELLRKIEQLVKDGATVLGPKPSRSPSLANQPAADEEVREIADRLWGPIDGEDCFGQTVGDGFIASGLSMEQMFDLINLKPDCRFDEGKPLVFAHRELADGDIYFVANQSKETVTSNAVFRIGGFKPTLWLPTTGEIRTVYGWTTDGETTTIPLEFAPMESFFIVFNEETQETAGPAEMPKRELVSVLNDDWLVTFDSGEMARGPKEPVHFDALTDWTASGDPAIRYYSGTAWYEKTFTLDSVPADKRLVLSFGKVAEMAKVTVNGEYAGGVWTAPYELDVTRYLKAGENQITVEVVNTWVNRLIGDAGLPESERKTWAAVNPYQADSPLKPSGLLEGVSILAE